MSQTIAFAATLACVLVTIRCAKVFAESTPRAFTILALFAFSWALLLPYYGPPYLKTELLSAWAGFIDVYVGLLLRREADVLQGYREETIVQPVDGFAVWLLGLIAVPSVPPVFNLFLTLDREIATLWLGFGMGILAFGSITYGLRRLHHGSKAWRWMLMVVVFYSALELVFALLFSPNQDMPDKFRYLFSVAKCVYTGVFLLLVLSKTVPQRERYPWWGLVFKFFGVVAQLPRPDLVVDSLAVGPPAAMPGASVTVHFVVRNRGTAPAAASLARIRLVPETTDLILASLNVPRLAPNTVIQLECSISVPISALSGDRAITVTANADDAFPERDHANNQRSAPFVVMA